MFENYVAAKTAKNAKWKAYFGTASIVIHVVVILALVIHGYWVIEKLPLPGIEATFASAPPPPPPPPPGGSKKKKTEKKKVKKPKPNETTQPSDKKKPDEPEDSSDDSNDEGVEGGVEGGVAGGVVGGVLGGVEGGVLGGIGDGPPPPPKKEQFVPQKALDAFKISGNENVQMPDAAATKARRDGKTLIVASAKLCLTAGGAIKSVRLIKKSGYSAYDSKITSTLRTWKYKPFKVNGKAVPVCTAVNFRVKL
jgi:protein TonB